MMLDLSKTGRIDTSLVKNISADMIPDVIQQDNIYHYTSINGLKDILHKKKLWFTHIDYMNDREEVIAGAEKLKEMGVAEYSGEYRKVIEAEAEEIKQQDHEAYICCFSLLRDELAMWNYYTKDVFNQGYNIGFDYKQLVISILKKNLELHGCKLTFGKVDYCNNGDDHYAKRVRDSAMETISRTLLDLVAVLQNKYDGTKGRSETKFDFSFAKYYGDEPAFRQSPTMSVLYLMKRPCFTSEVEFRIVLQVPHCRLPDLKKANKYKYRTSNGILIPYLELDFDVASLTGIMQSPTINSDLAERSIRDYCDFCDIDTKQLPEGIKKSVIPVRF